MKPSVIRTAGLLVCSQLLLTACSGGSGGGGPSDPTKPMIGLGVGMTNNVSCNGPNGYRTAPATAITLALRDAVGQPIAGNSNSAVVLRLKTPDGALYTFKNPYNADVEDDHTFQASENYFILCAAPLGGAYEISGTVDNQPVSDTQTLNASLSTAPPGGSRSGSGASNTLALKALDTPGNAILRVQGLTTAQAEFTAPEQTQAVLVNYYRGNQTNDGVYSGYRVGFGAKSASSVAITQAEPEKPRRLCDEECRERIQARAQQLPEETIPEVPKQPPGASRNRVVMPQGGVLIWSSGAVFSQGVADAGGLRSQALSGPQTVGLSLPAGHMQGEPYYAEIITTSVALGAATAPESLGRVDLNVMYTPVVTPADQNTAPWTARVSAAPMAVKNIVEKQYESLTTSLMTRDGFPSARSWDVSVRGPGGAVIWTYTYPAFTPYVLTAAPGQPAAGNYTADFTAPGVGLRTQTFAVAGGMPLKVPDDARLSLDADLQGFTFEAPSGPRSHWVYVTEDGSGTLVASRTCVVNAGERCTVHKRPGVSLSASKRYFLTLVSTEAPLDLNPLLAGTDWNFAQPIRWATQFKDAASNAGGGGSIGDLLLADVQDFDNRSIEADKSVQFGTFDKATRTPVALQGVNWTLTKLSRLGIVMVDPASGLVKGTGKDLGRFTVQTTYQGKTSQSEEFAVFGLVCVGGKANGGAGLLCKFRNAQGQTITNLPYTVQAAGWNNNQPFQIDQETPQGALAFDKFNGPLLAGAATYTFSVTVQGQTFTDTASIDANAAPMAAPVPQLQSEGQPSAAPLMLKVDAAPGTQSARIELECLSNCTNSYPPIIVPAQAGSNFFTIDVNLPPYQYDDGFSTAPKLTFKVTTFNVDLTQPDPDLPDQFKSASGSNTFFVCYNNLVRSSCPQ